MDDKPTTPLSSLLLDLKPPPGSSPARAFFLFDWMVTPILIRVIYVIASLAVVYTSLQTMFSKSPGDQLADQFRAMGGQPAAGSSGGQFWTGLAMMVVGLILVRVGCESMIVLYRLHDNVRAIRDRGGV